MLRAMYSRSFAARFGDTENCSTTSGQATPMMPAETSMSTVAMAGMARLRRKMDAKNAAATTIEMTSSTIFAGSSALMSV